MHAVIRHLGLFTAYLTALGGTEPAFNYAGKIGSADITKKDATALSIGVDRHVMFAGLGM
jgi:hypothetical protein